MNSLTRQTLHSTPSRATVDTCCGQQLPVCEGGNLKSSSQQMDEREEEGRKKASHNSNSNQEDPDYNSKHCMDGTSHTSHTSLSLKVQEARVSSDGYNSNIAISSVVSNKDTQVVPAAGEVSSIAEAKKSHRCFYCNEAFSNGPRTCSSY